jgi:membrane fusion protein
LSRDETLAAQGFLSTAQVQTRQAELLDLQARERQARRNLEALRREAQSVSAEIEAVRLQANIQQAQLDRVRAGLAQEGTEISARSLVHLSASTAATVGAVAVRQGHSVLAGQTVLSLLPARQEGGRTATAVLSPQSNAIGQFAEEPAAMLQAQLYAPSRSAGFVAPGQQVWMRLQAFPYQKFGMLPGEVTEVSRTPVQPQDLPAGMAQALMTAADAQEPLYRITVDLHRSSLRAFGQAQALKAGMVLEANVVQERRAIWEWVLEPLLAVNKRWNIPSDP